MCRGGPQVGEEYAAGHAHDQRFRRPALKRARQADHDRTDEDHRFGTVLLDQPLPLDRPHLARFRQRDGRAPPGQHHVP